MASLSHPCPICGYASLQLALHARCEPILRCSRCTCLLRPVWERDIERTTKDRQLAAFDERYLRARRSTAHWLRFAARHSLELVRRFAPPPGRLLEIGCATGEFCVCARDSGYEVEGLEMSPSLGAFARSTYGLAVMNCSVEALPPVPQYDVVVAIHTLEHLIAQLASLEAIRNSLLPGGHVVLEVPSGTSWSVRLQRGRSGAFTDEHLYFHTPTSLTCLLRRAGFDVLHVRSFEGYSGLFNAFFATAGISTVARVAVASLRKRGGRPVLLSQSSALPPSEPTIDAGRNILLGASILAGIGLSPLRWGLAALGLGGAVVAVARRPA